MQEEFITHPPAIEFAEKEEIDIFHSEKLQALLSYISEKSVYYKRVFAQRSIDLSDIKGIHDIGRFPITSKDDLAMQNEEFLCVPKSEIADYVTTSGTMGEPVAFFLTRGDIDRLGYNEAISMICVGASSNDVFQLMTTMDRGFIAGLAYWQGVQRLHAGIIRVGPGNALSQWSTIQKFKPSILIAVPSFVSSLLNYADMNGIDYNASSVKKIVCIGEAIRNENLELNELGKRISNKWNVKLYSTYASTEMGAAFTECNEGKGGHLHPELLIVEVLDNNDKPVLEGGIGEVVITTLGVEGMPLLRYRTGDICKAYFGKCSCGRTSMRIGPVLGRKQHLLKYKGTSLYPQAIYDAIDHLDMINDYIVKVQSDSYGNDELRILLPVSFRSEKFETQLNSLLRSKLRVHIPLEFMDDDMIQKIRLDPDKRKPIKLLDIRKSV